jgi:hypothetical protein
MTTEATPGALGSNAQLGPLAGASMQRYLAFKGQRYYPSQGMGDFFGDFAKLEDAISALTSCHKTQEAWNDCCEWAVVWDSEIRAQVWDNWMLPEA